jgi:IclR family KDG regulon transcriptional repressor
MAPLAAESRAGERGTEQSDINPRYQVRAVDRSLAVLVLLASTPAGLEASALARAAQLPVSTVFRILHTLKLRNFVVEAPGSLYRIGPRAFEVGSSFLQGTSLRSEGQAVVERLAAETGETASMGILDSDEVLYIAIAHGQRELGIQSNVGTRHPLYCTALGKVLLADLSWPDAHALLTRIERKPATKNTIVSLSRWHAELQEVAISGYALDSEERVLGVRAVAAPVRDHSGSVVAAISAAGPAFRFTGDSLEPLISHVRQLAAEFSRRLGYVAS